MLLSSQVPRALENKTRLFGFELPDLLLIFLYLSVSNLFLGNVRCKSWLTWGGTVLIAGFLYFVKRGKPDQYLQHLGEYFRSPGVFSAGAADENHRPYISDLENEIEFEKGENADEE
jgi:hypothetical protein